MPASDYEEALLLGGACRAVRRAEGGRDGAYRPYPLPGDKPHYAPDRTADVRHIKLDIALDFERRSIAGTCTTTLAAIIDGLSEVSFDAVELAVEAVTVDGVAAEFEAGDGRLRVRLPAPRAAGETFEVAVRYSATPRRGLYFVGPDDGYPDKPVQAWTQGQDEDSRHYFPCHDYPNVKATSEVIVTVPEQLYALSNGELLDNRVNGDGTRTFHWRLDVPHSCYLITLAAAGFSQIDDQSVDGAAVQYYVQRGREEECRRTLGRTPDMIRFFAEKLGVPYPYHKYATVFVADFIFGGMENTTATTLTDTVLLDERAFLDYNADSLVAHELAHQWFGDLLTCRDWSHAWLNEGFATYFDALYREHHLGEDEFHYWMLGVANTYFSEDPSHYRRPIVSNVYNEPIDLFDRHLYEKGSLVLHMLRSLLGDGLFWKAMHHYVAKHRTQSVITSDLQRAIEEATGRNLDWFFDEWVFKAGYPEFKVEYSWDDELLAAKLSVTQTQPAEENTPIFRMPVEVEFTLAGRTERRRVEVSEKEHVFYLPLPEKPLAVRFDPQNRVLKKLDFSRSKELLLHQLRSAPDALGRIDAVQGLGKLNAPEAVTAIEEALHNDPFWGVQAEAAKALGSTRSAAALRALAGAASVAHPKARRAVMAALGEFRGEDAAAAALAGVIERGDPSYFVEAEARLSLGKTRSGRAFELLQGAMDVPSFNEVIRSNALAGLGELGDERAVPLAVEWTRYGKPQQARSAAASALGKLAGRAGDRAKDDIRDALVRLLPDPWLRTRISAINALKETKDARVIGDLERAQRAELDGRAQRAAREAIAALREGSSPDDELKRLRDDLDRMAKENRELRDRLEKLEARIGGQLAS